MKTTLPSRLNRIDLYECVVNLVGSYIIPRTRWHPAYDCLVLQQQQLRREWMFRYLQKREFVTNCCMICAISSFYQPKQICEGSGKWCSASTCMSHQKHCFDRVLDKGVLQQKHQTEPRKHMYLVLNCDGWVTVIEHLTTYCSKTKKCCWSCFQMLFPIMNHRPTIILTILIETIST